MVVGVLVWLTPAPAEASRKTTVRLPAELATETLVSGPEAAAGQVAEVPAEDQPAPAPAPRRSFFDVLFGRKVESKAAEAQMDGRMLDAVRVAERSARRRSINRCWRFVKRALQEAELVECYPQTALAKEAAVELPERYGFKQIEVECPHDAPVGAVIVYGGRGAGHVELRSKTGFVSDHASRKPSPRPMIGVFIKTLGPLEG
ncbi:MAG: hypothetical protein WEC73_01420 [Chthoniobacterales bacterium]